MWFGDFFYLFIFPPHTYISQKSGKGAEYKTLRHPHQDFEGAELHFTVTCLKGMPTYIVRITL